MISITAAPARVDGVELTLLGASLSLSKSGVAAMIVNLDAAQSADAFRELQSFEGFRTDRESDPILLDGRTPVKTAARPTPPAELLGQPDCQVADVSFTLAGNRLLVEAGGSRLALNLNDEQAALVRHELEHSFEE